MRPTPTVLPAIPVVKDGDPDLLAALAAITESIEVLINRRGDPNDRAVTVRDLINAGMVKELIDGLPVDATIPEDVVVGFVDPRIGQSLSQPPAPTNVVITSTWHNVFVVFDEPSYYGHAFAEVWRSNDSTLANASLIGVTSGTLYRDGITAGTDYWYWVRFVNTANPSQFGPWSNNSTGTAITTSVDPAVVIAELTGLITESEFADSLNTRIDLIDVTDGGVVANLATETSTRISEDSAIVTTVTTAQATADSNTSAISTETTNRANADTAIAQTVTTAQATADGNTTAVSVNVTAIATTDGIVDSEFFVKIDDGRVSGFGLHSINGSSEFIILADKFAVALPSIQAGASLFPFIIANVGGTATIAMDAAVFIKDLSVDTVAIANAAIDTAQIANLAVETAKINTAAITNAKIGNLAVDTAQIAALAVETAKIKDLAVETVKIKGQAVTIPSSAYTAAYLATISTSYVTVQSVTFTATGAPVDIAAMAYVKTISGSTGHGCFARVKRDSTVIAEIGTIYIPGSNGTTVTIMINDTPTAASHTYYFQLKRTFGSVNLSAGNRFVRTLETKK